MYHYVYLITHIETGEFYYGSRTSECHPTLDPYMGSMSRWKPDTNKLKKEIIRDDFETREEALNYESELIKTHIKYELNRNYHIPNSGFSTYGIEMSEEHKKNIGRGVKGIKRTDEYKKKMSEAKKGTIITEEQKKKISKTKKG